MAMCSGLKGPVQLSNIALNSGPAQHRAEALHDIVQWPYVALQELCAALCSGHVR